MWKGQYPLGDPATWCKENGVHLHKVAIEYTDNRGNGLVAQSDIVSDGTNESQTVLLLTVPEDIIISSKNVFHHATKNDGFRQLLEAVGYQVMFHVTQMHYIFLS